MAKNEPLVVPWATGYVYRPSLRGKYSSHNRNGTCCAFSIFIDPRLPQLFGNIPNSEWNIIFTESEDGLHVDVYKHSSRKVYEIFDPQHQPPFKHRGDSGAKRITLTPKAEEALYKAFIEELVNPDGSIKRRRKKSPRLEKLRHAYNVYVRRQVRAILKKQKPIFVIG